MQEHKISQRRVCGLVGVGPKTVRRERPPDHAEIRTHEGFLYLAVVIDLFSRRVIGWSMQGRTCADIPPQALLMAVWRRKPKTKVQVHSDQGPQFTSYEWQEFLEQHNLTQSMSGRGNCWDNAVAESFFNMLKRERIRRRKYKTREEARQDVFDYIEFFYNPQRKHVRNGMLSPIAFEQQQKLKLQGVYQTRGYSYGKARYLDNIFIERLWRSLKYECVYLHAWETGSQARAGVRLWITFYNHQWPHAAHGGQPPAVVYLNATQTDQQVQAVA